MSMCVFLVHGVIKELFGCSVIVFFSGGHYFLIKVLAFHLELHAIHDTYYAQKYFPACSEVFVFSRTIRSGF